MEEEGAGPALRMYLFLCLGTRSFGGTWLQGGIMDRSANWAGLRTGKSTDQKEREKKGGFRQLTLFFFDAWISRVAEPQHQDTVSSQQLLPQQLPTTLSTRGEEVISEPYYDGPVWVRI